jgi:hypothetical protein
MQTAGAAFDARTPKESWEGAITSPSYNETVIQRIRTWQEATTS